MPKPRGGRNAPNPILSEDVYKQKVRKPRTKTKEAADDLDGTNMAFGGVKRHVEQPAHIAAGLAYTNTNWRNNPNERKHMSRSNRRR